MFIAIRVKGCLAKWAPIAAGQVFLNGQFIFAHAAKNCPGVPFIFIPNFHLVSCFLLVTIITRVIFRTAFEFDGNYVNR
jgi:hypothetical protein